MNKIVYSLIALATCIILSGEVVFAHGPNSKHSHDISSEQALETGSQVIKNLIEKGSLDRSWLEAVKVSVDKKTFENKPEWVVVFRNEKAADASKQTLYVFLTMRGEYLAANFSGK